MKISYHMIFEKSYSGAMNKYGGLPTHLPKKWPQINGCDMSFLFQLYCDQEKLVIPNTLCIQGYQLIENGDYNSDIVIVQIPLDAQRNLNNSGIAASSQIRYNKFRKLKSRKKRHGLQPSGRMKSRHTILKGASKPCLRRLYS